MKRFVKEQLVDHSDDEQFQFSFICVECGDNWMSTPIAFSKAREKPQTEAKRIILQALYRREWAQAMDRAVNEAIHHVNICPLCGRMVCNHCFVICDDLDMCAACSKYLQEHGEVVLGRAVGDECAI